MIQRKIKSSLLKLNFEFYTNESETKLTASRLRKKKQGVGGGWEEGRGEPTKC